MSKRFDGDREALSGLLASACTFNTIVAEKLADGVGPLEACLSILRPECNEKAKQNFADDVLLNIENAEKKWNIPFALANENQIAAFGLALAQGLASMTDLLCAGRLSASISIDGGFFPGQGKEIDILDLIKTGGVFEDEDDPDGKRLASALCTVTDLIGRQTAYRMQQSGGSLGDLLKMSVDAEYEGDITDVGEGDANE